MKLLKNLPSYIIYLVIVLFPVSVFGSFVDGLGIPKLILLIGGVILCVFVIAVKALLSGKLEFKTGNFDKVVFLANQLANKVGLQIALSLSGALLSLVLILSFLGVLNKLTFVPSFAKLAFFNPAGDYLTSSIFLICLIPIAASLLIKEKIVSQKVFLAFTFFIVLVGVGISVFTLVLNKSTFPVLPPFDTSWSVAIETVKQSPVLGIGPGNYLTAFNLYRPNGYNSSPYWQIRFSTSRSWYLTIVTETGVLGGVAIVLLAFVSLKYLEQIIGTYKEDSQSLISKIDIASALSFVALILVFVTFPQTPVTLMLLFLLMALNSKNKTKSIDLAAMSRNEKYIIIAVLAVLVIFAGVKTQPILAAEEKFMEASLALNNNDGKKAYDALRAAITLNPNVDRYHASYAQMNLAIARSIAGSVKDPKDLTTDQKNTISQLVQQAVREGQSTVALNPTRTANWQVLAVTYQSIIPFAQQADQYATQAYSETIALDPVDPTVRVNLGSLLFSLTKYDDAISVLQLAVLLKPDYANAHYNLAAAYREKGETANAIAELNSVLSLVPANSADYKQVKSELDSLNTKLAAQTPPTAGANSTLTAPQKATQKVLNPPLTLPNDATPPATPNVPTANPSSTPSTP